jgi:GH35 family endo-1,4-beta-xylanase
VPQLRSTLTQVRQANTARVSLKGSPAQHISVVVSRYRKQVSFFNVVSNAMGENGQLKPAAPWYPNVRGRRACAAPPSHCTHIWHAAMQLQDYIALAFQTAHTANPSVKLFCACCRIPVAWCSARKSYFRSRRQ